jgi:hypothetical protein
MTWAFLFLFAVVVDVGFVDIRLSGTRMKRGYFSTRSCHGTMPPRVSTNASQRGWLHGRTRLRWAVREAMFQINAVTT